MCFYACVTKARPPSTQAAPAPPLSPAVMAMAAQFVLIILDLMRMLEEAGGEAVTNYLRRTIGLEEVLAELRAIAEGLVQIPQSDDPDSDSLSDEYDDASENWIFYYPPPVPRANPASKPAGADARAEIHAFALCDSKTARFGQCLATGISLRFRNYLRRPCHPLSSPLAAAGRSGHSVHPGHPGHTSNGVVSRSGPERHNRARGQASARR
jgi:hypothetical protein